MFQVAMAVAAAVAQLISTPFTLDADSALMRRLKSGAEYITLEVSTSGVVTGCQVRISDGSSYEDVHNCKRIHKLKFKPANDQSGQSVYSKFHLITLAWGQFDYRLSSLNNPNSIYLEINRLPSGVRSDPITGVILVVSTSGKIESCDVSGSSGSAALDTLACKAALSSNTEALKDEAGEPVRSVQSFDVGFVPKG